MAIGRAELFSRVSRLAYEDPLTGLANRRAIEERLERAVVRARQRKSPLAVLLCDLDNLKQMNDERGHDAGDRALRRAGEALVSAAADHPGSAVGRLSGDEFCVILEGAGEKKIQVIKEVRSIDSGLGLKEAKALVDEAPKPVVENVPKDRAEEVRAKLTDAGAEVEVK